MNNLLGQGGTHTLRQQPQSVICTPHTPHAPAAHGSCTVYACCLLAKCLPAMHVVLRNLLLPSRFTHALPAKPPLSHTNTHAPPSLRPGHAVERSAPAGCGKEAFPR